MAVAALCVIVLPFPASCQAPFKAPWWEEPEEVARWSKQASLWLLAPPGTGPAPAATEHIA